MNLFFWAAAIHLKIGIFLSNEWGDPQGDESESWPVD